MHSYNTIFIDGHWVSSTGGDTISIVSPHDEQVIASVPNGTPADIDAAVGAARRAFDTGPWPRMTVSERLDFLTRLADLYEARLEDFAQIISAEMGAPITLSRARQATGGLYCLRSTISVAEEYEWEQPRPTAESGPAIVRRLPVGVVGAIAPFNFPQMLIMAKLAPALAAGCTVVVKPAPECPLDAMLLAELVEQAGLPAGVVNVVPADKAASEHLVAHPMVDKIAFTGSTPAGRQIASVCGRDMRRCTVELGGKSAAIILDDADPVATASAMEFASFANSGQGCVSQTRILVPRARKSAHINALADMVESLHVGDPSDPTVDVGPMVTRTQQQRVAEYIELGADEGATTVVGGPGMPEGLTHGWYVRPTLFADVHNGMRIAQEEIFGPVVCVIEYEDIDDAVRIAQDSPYGLGGSVWTNDRAAGMAVADRMRTGMFGINTFTLDFGSPFGGFKASGIGREFGPESLDEYTESQTLYVDAALA
ncbi:aldehyde dehydrogenase [Rhodococcus maanshanensis]|uniref:Betaine-aldehyde dehydrogenase n=1 Tax=Rhodococcus maanshanensis TaxID=183556 RepID=A0A1H7I3L6_9NOCA|nr:aldehyde dehydrogenase [Rhodococcus maanshanensis]SEK57119.1 betaine-aldehyde dehydrogenase [Rhodococcus maanshanensis]